MVPRHLTGIADALPSGAVIGILLLAGCTSSGQLEIIQQEIVTLGRQADRLEAGNASKAELSELEERLLAETERTHDTQAEILAQLESLSSAIGQLETRLQSSLTRIDQLSQQVLATQEDVRRLAQPVRRPSGEGGRAPILATDPEALYEAGHADYLRGNFELALLTFDEYLRSFPDTELADNALYWTGESHFSQKRFEPAILAFEELLTRFPASEKATSARMKQGFARIEGGDSETGIAQLRKLVQDYPLSDEAKLTQIQLEKLDAD